MRYLSPLLLAFLLVACDNAAPASSDALLATEALATTQAPNLHRAGVNQDLATARRATARYHRVQAALGDGYLEETHCVEVPGLGGMGYHYPNLAYLLDGGALDPATPEVVLYEPQRNGRLRLVAVEYIVPFEDEPRPENGGVAPELFGQEFHPSDAADGWALHVWLWKNNPTGLFMDFNPRVSCEHMG